MRVRDLVVGQSFLHRESGAVLMLVGGQAELGYSLGDWRAAVVLIGSRTAPEENCAWRERGSAVGVSANDFVELARLFPDEQPDEQVVFDA